MGAPALAGVRAGGMPRPTTMAELGLVVVLPLASSTEHHGDDDGDDDGMVTMSMMTTTFPVLVWANFILCMASAIRPDATPWAIALTTPSLRTSFVWSWRSPILPPEASALGRLALCHEGDALLEPGLLVGHPVANALVDGPAICSLIVGLLLDGRLLDSRLRLWLVPLLLLLLPELVDLLVLLLLQLLLLLLLVARQLQQLLLLLLLQLLQLLLLCCRHLLELLLVLLVQLLLLLHHGGLPSLPLGSLVSIVVPARPLLLLLLVLLLLLGL